ncbi:hypothetical protein A3L11_07025 [Thermococcus siculi]|uniref:Uncharacterized protein n=1 Tax=Thermococcus siculi TaxID=72803 RepID=A0A2Z2MNJ9_9EURY|nr:hypothetical protein [Thermococcus siculi]ASJ08991.1 hypothetical protein A3L11_07025 [Thermococcus siculi]
MKENVTPSQMKWGISIIMTLVYAFGAAWFYYLPARGEPGLEVEFWRLLLHFLVLSFLFWIILIPERKSQKAADSLMFTVLAVPVGMIAALLLLFVAGKIGLHETYGLEYFFLAAVPFAVAYKVTEDKIRASPFVLALVYWVIAYLWGSVAW